jgi:ketosteroid isomerase-like protein
MVKPQTPDAVLDAYAAAVYNRDAEAFLQLYCDSARVFDTWAVWSYEGTASRRQAIEGWFSSLGQERVKVNFEDVQATMGAEVAVLTATGRFAALSAEGVEIRSMQNRLTWGLQRDGTCWRIVHEHTSVPIAFSDLKGILQRAAT